MFKLSHYFMNEAGEGDALGAGNEQQQDEAQQQAQPQDLLGTDEQQQEPLIKALPGEDDAEGWGKLWDKLGRPETADGYELPVPEGDSGEFAKAAGAIMHSLGITKSQAQALAAWNNEQITAQQDAYNQQLAQRNTENVASIRKEWGNNFDANLAVANQALSAFMSPEGIQLLKESGLASNPHLVNAFFKAGQSLSEAKTIKGEPAHSGPKSTADIFYGSN